ncbi:MAG: YeeE/YedE family protein [Lysobacterales bacterium]
MIETAFTPWQSLAGGALIGLAAVLLMASLGRIMGATGILAGMLFPVGQGDWAWRASFVAGSISGPLAVFAFTGHMPTIQVPVSTPMLLVGGFIVGIGVTLGSGCTSGHGVCGIARLSPRSMLATFIFMVSTGITVFVLRHVMST